MSGICLLGEFLEEKAGAGLMEFDSVFVGGLVGVSPNLAFWIAVIVLASIMLRRGGGRAERFIIAGASLKLVSNLFNVPAAAIAPWLVNRGTSIEYASSVASGFGILRGVVSMAGITCLVYAFWVKFNAMNFKTSEPGDKEAAPQY